MLPKIRFRYSWVYDQRHRKIAERMGTLESYPSEESIRKYIEQITKVWETEGGTILRELSKISGIKWKEREIICYIVGQGRCFSDPLTMKYMKNKSEFVDTLTHELIHNLFMQKKGTKPFFIAWRKRFAKESIVTQNHILLHAVHKELYLRVFSKTRLARDIKKCQEYPDYKRSWDIVEALGHKELIDEFRNYLKRL